MKTTDVLDLCGADAQVKKTLLLRRFVGLSPGTECRVRSDENPEPFLDPFRIIYAREFVCAYERKGPDVWSFVMRRVAL